MTRGATKTREHQTEEQKTFSQGEPLNSAQGKQWKIHCVRDFQVTSPKAALLCHFTGSLTEELQAQLQPLWVGWQSSSGGPAPSLLTLRNLWRRKANQFVSIFSATDSVLGEPGGDACYRQSQTTSPFASQPQEVGRARDGSGRASSLLLPAPVGTAHSTTASPAWLPVQAGSRMRPARPALSTCTQLTAHHSPDGDGEPGDTRLLARGANYSLAQ